MSEEQLKDYFSSEGMKCDIIDKTPSMMQSRGVDILVWLQETDLEIEKFVIIDDINEMTNMEQYLVLIDSKTGLTKDYREQIKGILKSDKGREA